jgi:hypothetical protein
VDNPLTATCGLVPDESHAYLVVDGITDDCQAM